MNDAHLHRFPATSSVPGWPVRIFFEGHNYVRLRDGSRLSDENARLLRLHGVDPVGVGHEVLYAKVVEQAPSARPTKLAKAELDTNAMYSPCLAESLRDGKAKLCGMASRPWLANDELQRAGLALWEFPDLAKAFEVEAW